MDNVKIGTSGFSYDDWVGKVYPENIKKGDMLNFYAHELGMDIVELNYTYYTMPTAKGLEGMISKVPEDFSFVIKAHSSMTHEIRGSDGSYIRNEEAFDKYLAGIAPLIDGEHLKCVLAQFPLKFRKSDAAIEHLKWFAGMIKPARLTVELRNREWLTQSVFNLLKSLDVSFCVVDEPNLPRLMPFQPVATADLAYFRFHGRNRNWFNVPTNVRYDYLYSDEELRQFIEPIGKVSKEAQETLIFFNNHFQGSAIENAKTLKKILE